MTFTKNSYYLFIYSKKSRELNPHYIIYNPYNCMELFKIETKEELYIKLLLLNMEIVFEPYNSLGFDNGRHLIYNLKNKK